MKIYAEPKLPNDGQYLGKTSIFRTPTKRPFALQDRFYINASALAGSKQEDFEDEALAVTPAQLDLLLLNGLDQSAWVTYTFTLPDLRFANHDRLSMTWQAIASCNPALRTCLTTVDAQSPLAFQHRVLKKPLPMGFAGQKPQGIMAPYLVYQENENELSTLSIHIHPALIDESCFEELKNDFQLFYHGYAMPFRLPFQVYIRDVHTRNQDEASKYWLQEFDSFRNKPLFGTSTRADDRDTVLSIVDTSPDLALRFSAFEHAHQGLSEPLLLAAWGIVISRHLDMEDVAFTTAVRDDIMEGSDDIISYLEVNVPVRLNIQPEEPIQDLLHRVKEMSDFAKRFGYIGFRKIETICPNLKDVQTSIRFMSGVRTARSEHRGTSNVEVEIDLTSARVFVSHPSKIKEMAIRIVVGHLLEALNSMLLRPADLVQDVNIASPTEIDQLLAVGKATTSVTPKLLQELIESQCKTTPDAPAVHFLDQQPTTYSQLNSMANRVARQLHEMIIPGTTVAVHMEISRNFVVALFAILKAGGAYVIVDPEHPTDRKKFVLANSLAKLCVIDNKDHGYITGMGLDIGVLSVDDILDISEDDENLELTIDVESPAYIIYTSGSTGIPKGVVLSHRAASSGILCAADLPSFRTLLFYNAVFSAAQRTIFSTLAHGGCLCLASRPHLRLHLSETINSLQVNNLGITASTITLLDPESVPTLSRVTVTGESPNSDLIHKWAGRVELRNNYGLSECTQLNWGAVLSKANPTSRAIGFASDTTSAYIFGRNDTQLTPFMVPGELCLAGPQLANGYIGRPELTASSFVPHPFRLGDRLYRTGDLAIRLDDGSIEILGRKDSQVKINGQRVELGEVEAVLRGHEGADVIAVVAAVLGGRKSLVGCIIRSPEWVWSSLILELRAMAVTKLPTYMVPSFWLEISSLPVNRNGKTDINALVRTVEQKTIAELVGNSIASNGTSSRDLTKAELALQAATARSLGLSIDLVDIDGSFLGLGGDSLRAINIVSELLQQGHITDVSSILLSESLSQSASTIKELDEGPTELPKPFAMMPKDVDLELGLFEDVYPVTSLQESVLASHLVNGSYVYDRSFRIGGKDITRLKAAFNKVIQESPIYRTTFVQASGSYLQGVVKDFSLPWDVYRETAFEDVQKISSKMEFLQPFIRALQIDHEILIIRIHHALFDFWSSRFLFEDVAAAYLEESYPTRPLFSSFVREVSTLDIAEAKQFWASHLQDAPLSKLETKAGAPFNSVKLSLDVDLRALGTASRLTIGALSYAAWALILWKHTRNQDVIFAITLSGRDAKIRGIQHLNGPTLVTVPFRVHIDPSARLLDFANDIQTKLWEVAKYSQFGMRKALEACGQRITPFDTMVNFLVKNQTDARTEQVLPAYSEDPVWQTGLTTLELKESKNGSLEVQISGKLEPVRTKFVAEQVAQVFKIMAEDGATEIKNVEFISSPEASFLAGLSAVASQPEPTFLHQPFQSMAASKPDDIAIEFENEEKVSYSQLNARANRMARELVRYGVGPDALVPICLAKSVETIVCILAILKAGGGFVPLDPDNPPERNNFIVGDVKASVILTDENYAPIFANEADSIRIVDVFALDLSAASDANLEIPELKPDHLAYAIYTSGSTGQPKGVLIPHKSIAAGIESIIVAEGVESSWRNLQFSNYVFDVAIGDIFCTFATGAVLCIAPFERLLADLAEVVNSMKVTRLFLTPTVARLLRPEQVPGVEGIYLAGEPVTADLVEIWAPHCTVMNCYGPTEASILTVAGRIEAAGNSRVIGRPLKNTSVRILDPDNLTVVPYGAIGELCLGGSQLARGYLNRPEATQNAFVMSNGERLYRTGDLARWVASGNIECLGRKDNQVKINGHRIEIGEIENAILSTGSVHDAAVLVVDFKGKSQIVAFCVVEPGQEHDPEVLSDMYRETLALLSISLPSLAPYMRPQIWIPLNKLPRLPSGKTDRKGLTQTTHAMGDSLQKYSLGSETTEMHPAITSEQILLQTIWAELFSEEAKSISITSAFFSYGGDSISAINLVGRCRGHGYLLTVSDVLAHPILQDMALRMRSIAQEQTEYDIPRLEASNELKFQLAQAGIEAEDIQGIWPTAPGIEEFLVRGAEKEQFWQCQTVRRVPADFDFEHWQQLAIELTQRNDILRSMWVDISGEWLQIVLKGSPIDVAVVECEGREEVKDAVRQSWEARFAVGAGKPFIRYRLLVDKASGTRDLLIKIHHAMYDGTLLRIFDDQFRAFHRKQQAPPFVEFSKYVGYLSAIAKHKENSISFWKDLLADRAAPFPACHRANATETVFETVDSRVDAFAAQCGVTAPIVFQTAFTLILAKLSGSSDVNYDNLLTGRNIDMEDAQIINGNCANFLPFRIKISPKITVRELLTSTQNLFWKTTEHGDVNTTRIYDACGETRDTAANRALFLFQPFDPVVGSVKHMRWMVMAGSSVQMTVDYALHLEVSKTASGYKLKFQYDPNVYTVTMAKEVAQNTVDILQDIITKPYLPAQTLFMSAE